MFENLSSAIKENEELYKRVNTSTTQHLQPLKTVLKRYFPELKEQEATFFQNPLSTALNVSNIPQNYKTNFMIIKIIHPHLMFFRKWHSLSQ